MPVSPEYEIATAYQQGVEAGQTGAVRSSNPYADGPTASEKSIRSAWFLGSTECQVWRQWFRHTRHRGSFTWNKAPGTKSVVVVMIGGGSGGGSGRRGAIGTVRGGGGGGAGGGFLRVVLDAGAIPNSAVVVVGAGSAGAATGPEAPANASRAKAKSRADWKRSSGPFSRHRRTMRSMGVSPDSSAGSCFRMACSASTGVSPANARRPFSISYKIAPKAKMSAR